jgi:hypothetical protein
MIIQTTQGQSINITLPITTTADTITLDAKNAIDLTIALLELMRLANEAGSLKSQFKML